MREEVGEMTVRVPKPNDHRSKENYDTEETEGQQRSGEMEDKTLTGGPVNDAHGDNQDASKDAEGQGVNTAVSADEVEVESAGSSEAATDEHAPDDDRESEDEDNDDDDGGEGKGRPRKRSLVGKVKDWRQHEKELHRDHRGIMQAKPVRTAEWIKDNVKDSVHNAKDHFKMKSRQPDVETEV